MKPRILIIDDKERDLIGQCFSTDRYIVDCVNAGSLALQCLRSLRYECIVMGSPIDVPPAELVECIRRNGLTMPILLLSEKTSASYKETLFDLGVDEFIARPYDAIELAARVRALLRRSSRYLGDVLTAQNLAVNTSTLRVFRSGLEVRLAPMEFNLLVFLLRNSDRVYTAEELAMHVWPDQSQPTVEAIRTCVKSLRRKSGTGSSLIKTAYGSGYYLDSKNSEFATNAETEKQAPTVLSAVDLSTVPVVSNKAMVVF